MTFGVLTQDRRSQRKEALPAKIFEYPWSPRASAAAFREMMWVSRGVGAG